MLKCFQTNVLEFQVAKDDQAFHTDILSYIAQDSITVDNNKYSLTGTTACHGQPNLASLEYSWSANLRYFIQEVSGRYFHHITGQTLDFSQTRIDCWYITLQNNDMSMPHVHPGSEISGCYYLDIPDDLQNNEGAIVLVDPRPAARYSKLFSSSDMIFKPKTGMGLVFPSWLEHYTVPHRSSKLRISIAWNINLIE